MALDLRILQHRREWATVEASVEIQRACIASSITTSARPLIFDHLSAPPGGRRVSRDPPGGLPRELEANLDSHQSSDRPQSGGRLVRLPVVDDVVDAVREHVSPDTTHALHPSFQFITMPHRFKLNHLGPMRRIFSAVLRSRGHGDGGDSHKHAPMRLVSKKAPLE